MKAINKDKVKKAAIKYGIITLGSIFFSLGVALFLNANHVSSGGVTGIAIIIEYLTGFPTGYLIIFINIPLFILGAIFFGRNFIISTVYSTVSSSLLVELWKFLFKKFYHLPITENLLIACVLGGGLLGAGLGLIFRMGSSTGGTDVIVKILRKKFRYIQTGIISMMIDILIVLCGAFIYRDFELTCYTLVALVTTAIAFDGFLYGGNSAKLVYIITSHDCAQAMSDKILHELDVGATFVDGEGAYTGKDKRIILCACKSILYPKLRDIVHEVDPHAFTIVTSAKEIYGEGYKDNNDGDL